MPMYRVGELSCLLINVGVGSPLRTELFLRQVAPVYIKRLIISEADRE